MTDTNDARATLRDRIASHYENEDDQRLPRGVYELLADDALRFVAEHLHAPETVEAMAWCFSFSTKQPLNPGRVTFATQAALTATGFPPPTDANTGGYVTGDNPAALDDGIRYVVTEYETPADQQPTPLTENDVRRIIDARLRELGIESPSGNVPLED